MVKFTFSKDFLSCFTEYVRVSRKADPVYRIHIKESEYTECTRVYACVCVGRGVERTRARGKMIDR